MCCRTKSLSVSVVSESMPHLRKGAMRDFLNIMKMTNRYVDAHYNRTNSIYRFGNGSYIEFFPADSADKLRGSRRDVLFINECNNITRESYTQLSMRTSKDIFLDYNPSHRFWIDEVLDEQYSEKLILTYRDNEALDENIINFLESKRALADAGSEYWKNWCRVYLDGKQGALEGVVFNNWRVIDNIPIEAELLGYGLDFGFTNDPTAMVALYRLDGKLLIDEIIYQTGLTNNQISNLIKSECVDNVEIYADSAEPKSIREIQNHGIRKILPCKKGRDSILFGIQLLQDYELKITNRSKNLIDELNRYSWKKDKNGQTLNIPIDIYNHGIDALRYISSIKLDNRVVTANVFRM